MDENTSSTAGPGGAAGEAGTESSAGRFGRARDYVGSKYEEASGKFREGYNTMRERVDDADFGAMADQVRGYVRSNPGKALLLSIGVGFLIGLLLRHDDEE